MGEESLADSFMSAWTPRIHLPEERPPELSDFPESNKETSLRILREFTYAPSCASQLPSLVILLCEHLTLSAQPRQSDKLPQSPLDGSVVVAINDLLWSTTEHCKLAEKAVTQMLAAEGLESLGQFLGKIGNNLSFLLANWRQKKENGAGTGTGGTGTATKNWRFFKIYKIISFRSKRESTGEMSQPAEATTRG